MEQHFEQFEAEDKCNCPLCKRHRYEEDLTSRLNPHLPHDLQNELAAYFDWYFSALQHAETQIEAEGIKKSAFSPEAQSKR